MPRQVPVWAYSQQELKAMTGFRLITIDNDRPFGVWAFSFLIPELVDPSMADYCSYLGQELDAALDEADDGCLFAVPEDMQRRDFELAFFPCADDLCAGDFRDFVHTLVTVVLTKVVPRRGMVPV